MTRPGRRRRTTAAVALGWGVLMAAAVVSAHDVLYPGTVLTVEPRRIQVKTVDPDTKKDASLWFTVTRDTKVKRGDKIVPFADAKIAKDERVVVVVNHGAETEHVATEVRLAAR